MDVCAIVKIPMIFVDKALSIDVEFIPHSVTNLEFMPCIFSYGKAWSPTPSSFQLVRANAKPDGKKQQHKLQVFDRMWYMGKKHTKDE